MEKTLSLGAFEELAENEIMETEGGLGLGWLAIPVCGLFALAGLGVVCIVEDRKAKNAQKAASVADAKYVKMVDEAVMLGQNVPLSSIKLADQLR